MLQLSDATSYEERATLRQILRKRKKERGETSTRSKPRGNSVYNRFAGSTVTKTPAKSGGGVMKSVSVFIDFVHAALIHDHT